MTTAPRKRFPCSDCCPQDQGGLLEEGGREFFFSPGGREDAQLGKAARPQTRENYAQQEAGGPEHSCKAASEATYVLGT